MSILSHHSLPWRRTTATSHSSVSSNLNLTISIIDTYRPHTPSPTSAHDLGHYHQLAYTGGLEGKSDLKKKSSRDPPAKQKLSSCNTTITKIRPRLYREQSSRCLPSVIRRLKVIFRVNSRISVLWSLCLVIDPLLKVPISFPYSPTLIMITITLDLSRLLEK